MSRRYCPRVSVLALAAALVMVLSFPASAQTDPGLVLQQLVDAVNRDDVATQVALVSDDVIFIGGPCGEAPGGVCVGKDQFRMAVEEGGARVTITSMEVSGNIVRFRVEERFDFPPEAAAAGVERFVELGTIVIEGDKVARAGLIADVTDPQTVTLLRIFATMGPPPGDSRP